MKKNEFFKMMEKICPGELAEDWDNCGIQVNTRGGEVANLMTALEITDRVIDEAVSRNIDMIVTHHPMMRDGLKSVDSRNVTGRYINRLIETGISVYACHTSFDKMDGGNNDYLGKLLKLEDIGLFGNGNLFCRRGFLKEIMSTTEFVEYISTILGVDRKYFKYSGDADAPVRKLGWCTGGGAQFIEDAAEEKCDLYITGDVKYHDAQNASAMGINVLDAGHYGTEKIFSDNMRDMIRRALEESCKGETGTGKEVLKPRNVVSSSIEINPYLW